MPEQSEKDLALIDEFVRQIGTQSALIAGFTFAILAFVPFDSSTPHYRGIAFVICAVLTVAFELFTAFIVSSFGFVVKINFSDKSEDIFQFEMNLAYLAYLIGIISFLATLILLAWIKYPSVAVWVTVIISTIFVLGVAVFSNMVRKNNNLTI